MMAIDLLKDKLRSLEESAPFVEERMKDLIKRQNKKIKKLEVDIDDILRQNKDQLDVVRDVVAFQISILDQSELIKETNKQIKDYKRAIERLEASE